MKKKSLYTPYTSIQKLIFISFLFLLTISIQSCSNDSDTVNSEDTTNAEFITKSTEPVPNTDGTFVEVDLISWKQNCFKYQVRIVFVNQKGERAIAHSAIIQTGSGCETEGLVTNSYEGDYKGDFIIRDDMPTGTPIRTYLDNNSDVYQDYTNERDKAITEVR